MALYKVRGGASQQYWTVNGEEYGGNCVKDDRGVYWYDYHRDTSYDSPNVNNEHDITPISTKQQWTNHIINLVLIVWLATLTTQIVICFNDWNIKAFMLFTLSKVVDIGMGYFLITKINRFINKGYD